MQKSKLQVKNRNYREKELNVLIQPILQKYEKLGLIDSPLYLQLKQCLKDASWQLSVYEVLEGVEDAKFIFSIAKEITKQKNDQRVLEMFSEIDSAKWLIKGAIDGKYNKIQYLRKQQNAKSPDFLAFKNSQRYVIEVKMLSPEDIKENKFISKIISKLINEAIPQLQEFYDSKEFIKGLVLMWSHKPVQLQKIEYQDINKAIQQSIIKLEFPTSIYMTIYNHGIWDFHL